MLVHSFISLVHGYLTQFFLLSLCVVRQNIVAEENELSYSLEEAESQQRKGLGIPGHTFSHLFPSTGSHN